MENIFITGATGYIGSNLALKLADSGKIVHALCRSRSKASSLDHKNIVLFEGDILDKESIEASMRSCENVYHLAAYGSIWSKDPQTYFDINIQGTVNILNAAAKLGVKKVVFTSTAGTFGPSINSSNLSDSNNSGTGNSMVNEKSIRTIDFFTEHEHSKFLAEKKVQHYARRNELDAVIVCPSRVYGPGLLTKTNVATKIMKLYIEGKWRLVPGSGKYIGNYAYIDDVINGHIQAMNKGISGEKYILGGTNVSNNEIFDMIAKISLKNYKMYHIPISLVLTLARVQELFAWSFNRPPVITSKWVKRYLYNWVFSSEKAEKELGYKITPLEEGIEKTLQWLNTKNI